jgi:hypothetical protein
MDRARANGCRYSAGLDRGHYESWFLRGNHPTRPLAFWIRYTIFAPRGRPDDAVGELWAIAFDGETEEIRAVRERVPMRECSFARDRLDVRIGDAVLDDDGLRGVARDDATTISWQLRIDGGGAPVLLLPERMYEGALPAAKVVVPRPLARFSGMIDAGTRAFAVDGWLGSQNHNWGRRHTDRYAWGQIAGFDGDDSAFLECSTARLRFGPLWTPPLTVAVLRLGDETLSFTGVMRAVRARGRVQGLDWSLTTQRDDARLSVRLHAPALRFVGLMYDDPPGGARLCLNCKLAACELELVRSGAPTLALRTAHRAAFELVGHDVTGIPVAVFSVG